MPNNAAMQAAERHDKKRVEKILDEETPINPNENPYFQ